MLVAPEIPSAKPYLLRAMYEWCGDQGLTPYVSVFVDEQVQVPMEFVKNSEIVLNVGLEATNSLLITNEALEFKARFGGIPRQIHVPVTHIMAIYGRENGQGMAFPISDPAQLVQSAVVTASTAQMSTSAKISATPEMKKEKTKPLLTRVK
jgi:stringent starvation protein B